MLGCFHTYHYVDKPQTPKLILLPHVPFMSQTLLCASIMHCSRVSMLGYSKIGELAGVQATAERPDA